MEIAEPSIASAYATCVRRGANHIIVCPYFLGPGKHWTSDIPNLTARLLALAKQDPDFRPAAAGLLIVRGKVAKEAVGFLEEVGRSPKADPLLRAKVLRALWRGTTGNDGLEAAIRGLAAVGDPAKAAQPLQDLHRDFTTDFVHAKKLPVFLKAADATDAEQRALAYVVLLNLRANKNASKPLKDSVDAVVDKALGSADRAAGMLKAIGTTRTEEYNVRVQSLVKSDRPEVRTAALETVKLLGLDRPPVDRKNTLAALKYEDILEQAVQEKGDAALGARLFLKQNCIA